MNHYNESQNAYDPATLKDYPPVPPSKGNVANQEPGPVVAFGLATIGWLISVGGLAAVSATLSITVKNQPQIIFPQVIFWLLIFFILVAHCLFLHSARYGRCIIATAIFLAVEFTFLISSLTVFTFVAVSATARLRNSEISEISVIPASFLTLFSGFIIMSLAWFPMVFYLRNSK